MKNKAKSDFLIHDAGPSLVLLLPVSEDAKAWAGEHIDIPDYANPRSIPVEPRYLEPLVMGILDSGMTISS